jgi:transcriptional regulatory protein LEU3
VPSFLCNATAADALQLKCDVQQDPFVACKRCTKHNFKCVIEPNFKRIGKRTRNAEMEREMEELRKRLAIYEGRGGMLPAQQPIIHAPQPTSEIHAFAPRPVPPQEDDAFLQSHNQQTAATSLLELRSGSPMMHALDGVRLSPLHVTELFTEFFERYHPFLPFLDPTRSPDEVCTKDNKLLFWAVISVAARHYDRDAGLLQRLKEPLTNLIWQTIKGQTNHHVVKALCLLCYWPLPQSRTAIDPTFMLCGMMMQIAMQIGLHQPTHPQDFSRKKIQIQEEDIHDRLRTWAVCNIVAQTYVYE